MLPHGSACRICILALVGLIVLGVLQTASAEVHAVLFVGTGSPDFTDILFGPEGDLFESSMEEMRFALRDHWKVKEANILPVKAWEIRRLDFKEKIKGFVEDLGPDDTLLFYYVGHGDESGLQPSFFSGDSYLFYDELDDWLGHNAENTVIILDSCSSGSAADELVSEPDRRLLAAASAGRGARVSGWVGAALDLIGAPVTPFTAALVDAIRSGTTSIKETFETGMNSLTAFIRESRAGRPVYFYPEGKADLTMTSSVQVDAATRANPCASFTVWIKMDKSIYVLCEHPEPRYFVSRPASIRIIDHSPNGSADVLFEGHVDAGEHELLPPLAGMVWCVIPPFGIETLEIIATDDSGCTTTAKATFEIKKE